FLPNFQIYDRSPQPLSRRVDTNPDIQRHPPYQSRCPTQLSRRILDTPRPN
ncbi:hypothetical protein CPAR01_02721, partial [Colletotrichum paranaense]